MSIRDPHLHQFTIHNSKSFCHRLGSGLIFSHCRFVKQLEIALHMHLFLKTTRKAEFLVSLIIDDVVVDVDNDDEKDDDDDI